jgi:hypothetical protein
LPRATIVPGCAYRVLRREVPGEDRLHRAVARGERRSGHDVGAVEREPVRERAAEAGEGVDHWRQREPGVDVQIEKRAGVGGQHARRRSRRVAGGRARSPSRPPPGRPIAPATSAIMLAGAEQRAGRERERGATPLWFAAVVAIFAPVAPGASAWNVKISSSRVETACARASRSCPPAGDRDRRARDADDADVQVRVRRQRHAIGHAKFVEVAMFERIGLDDRARLSSARYTISADRIHAPALVTRGPASRDRSSAAGARG